MRGMLGFIGKLSFVVFLLVLLFSYAMFQGGFVSWFLFFGFLPIFINHIGLLFYPIKKWKVTRQLSHHVVRAGDRVAVTLQIHRKTPYPLYYCICEEIFPDTLQKAFSHREKYRYMDQPEKLHVQRRIKKLIFPGFRRHMELPYTIEQVPRGEHELHAIRVRTGDFFGFIKKEQIFYVKDQIIAVPDEQPVHLTENINSFEQGSLSSYARNLKNTNVATGVREYMPGDKFSWIDWKQSAKKNTIITKEFEQEKSTDTAIILNACNHEGINELAFEAGIELTLSLISTIQRHSSQVSLIAVGEETAHFPIQNNAVKKERVKQYLTKVQPEGARPFSMKLKEEMMKIGSGVNMILVTTHVDQTFQETIQQVKQRSRRVVILFIQASSLISRYENNIIQQLRYEGVVVNVLTEKQLMQEMVGVNIS
ncbi:DUF58 domain-containing protein [Virgibacillus kekensis]|uniref:DUF58 domain-containing protein n=1 Tax=Virgibacillus kekensis TaxID=202261 RepID=A0ABV9DMW6_9BACI